MFFGIQQSEVNKVLKPANLVRRKLLTFWGLYRKYLVKPAHYIISIRKTCWLEIISLLNNGGIFLLHKCESSFHLFLHLLEMAEIFCKKKKILDEPQILSRKLNFNTNDNKQKIISLSIMPENFYHFSKRFKVQDFLHRKISWEYSSYFLLLCFWFSN